MQKKPGSKTPLCNFINNCRQFKLTGSCKFLHTKCKESAQCTYGEKCKFYHPERTGISRPPRQQQQRGKSKKNLNQIPCQFGLKCKKKQFNQCPYNHNNLPSLLSQKPIQILCKYGDKCNKLAQGICKYKHIDTLKKSQLKQQNYQKHMSIQQSNVQNSDKNNNNKQFQYNAHQMDNNVQFRQFEQKKICPRFAIGQCDQQQCNQAHQFTLDNSIKRLYFKVFQQQSGSNKIFCTMFKLNGNRLFALTRDNILSFYELDDENQILKTVSASQLKLQSTINSLYVQNDPENKNFVIILTTQNNKIHRFYPLEGKIESMNFPESSHVSQTGCFGQQNIIFAGNKVTQMLVLKNQKKDPIIMQKLSQNSPDVINGKLKVIRNFSLLGENFLIIGTKLGYLSFINKQFLNKSIQIPNSTIYNICTTILSSKPFAFAVVSSPINSSAATNLQKYQIVSINLLNFSMGTVLSTEIFQISTVCCVYDRIFVGINQVGVLVYALSDLSKIKGRIPISGNITSLQGDNDGNLLICSQNTQQNQLSSTISVYKIRK